MAKLKVSPRELVGKKVRSLRKEGVVPATMYGPKYASVNVNVNADEFKKLFNQVGFSKLFDVEEENGNKEKVLIKEVQTLPTTDAVLHISLYVIDKNSPITADIPVEMIGVAPAEDLGVGFVVNTVDTVTVRCLPDKLPAKFEVSIDKLENIGDGVTVADLAATFEEGVELDSKMDPTTTIVSVVGAQKEIVEEVAPVAEGEEGAEGAEGAEGEAAEGEGAEGAKEEGDKE